MPMNVTAKGNWSKLASNQTSQKNMQHKKSNKSILRSANTVSIMRQFLIRYQTKQNNH